MILQTWMRPRNYSKKQCFSLSSCQSTLKAFVGHGKVYSCLVHQVLVRLCWPRRLPRRVKLHFSMYLLAHLEASIEVNLRNSFAFFSKWLGFMAQVVFSSMKLMLWQAREAALASMRPLAVLKQSYSFKWTVSARQAQHQLMNKTQKEVQRMWWSSQRQTGLKIWMKLFAADLRNVSIFRCQTKMVVSNYSKSIWRVCLFVMMLTGKNWMI